MKKLLLTSALATLVVLGFNAPTEALSPQVLTAKTQTQSMSFGATETVNITLHDGQLQYTVPTGKVLHVEHFIWALEGDATHQNVAIIPANEIPAVGDVLLKFSTLAPDIWTPERPLQIPADGNSGLRILNNGAADWRDVVIVGYLTNQ